MNIELELTKEEVQTIVCDHVRRELVQQNRLPEGTWHLESYYGSSFKVNFIPAKPKKDKLAPLPVEDSEPL
jgi:hypothetical protein